MRLFLVCAAALPLSGCFGGSNLSDPVTDTLAQTPFMYKADVQQGNVVTQEQVNKLEPGMSMEQVRYLMGTPMLQDTFHENRWDYVYTMKKGGDKVEQKRVTLTFQDGQLAGIEGDYRPDPAGIEEPQETVVTVPDQKKPGFIDNTLKSIGFGEDTAPKAAPTPAAEQSAPPAPIPTEPAPQGESPSGAE